MFKDDDVRNLRGFLTFVREHARFDVDLEESVQLTKYVSFMQSHVKQVNDHVMELISLKEKEKARDEKPE